MILSDNAERVLRTLASAAPARAPTARRLIRVDEVCADLQLSEREVRQAVEDLARAGLLRPAHVDLRTVVVTVQGRARAERLALAEAQARARREAEGIDISSIIGGA